MPTWTVKETTTAADGSQTVVTHAYELSDGDYDALTAASIAAFLRVPDTARDQILASDLAAYQRANVGPAVDHYVQQLDRSGYALAQAQVPRYIVPGDGQKAIDALDGILTIAADGSIYRDGVRLGVSAGSCACVYGATILVKAKTPTSPGVFPVYKWDGVRWTAVTVDPGVIQWPA